MFDNANNLMVFNITQFLKLEKFMNFLLNCFAYMNNKTKLKIIEEEWVKNNFQISDKQVSQIVNN